MVNICTTVEQHVTHRWMDASSTSAGIDCCQRFICRISSIISQALNIPLAFWAVQITNSQALNNSRVPYHWYCISWKSECSLLKLQHDAQRYTSYSNAWSLHAHRTSSAVRNFMQSPWSRSTWGKQLFWGEQITVNSVSLSIKCIIPRPRKYPCLDYFLDYYLIWN